MSIIQEALKRAQYNYAGKKGLPQPGEEPGQEPVFIAPAKVAGARGIAKNTGITIYIIALLALVVGFGIRAVFSKLAAMGKDERSKYFMAEVRKSDPVQTAVPSVSPRAVEQATEKLLALVSSGQANRAPELILNGIMYVEEKPKAIINGTVVRVGDAISGATVTSITENNVLLKYNNNDNQVEMALRLKD